MTLTGYAVRLAIPCLLGVAGFAINYQYLERQTRPQPVLAVNQTVRPGSELSDAALTVVELPGAAIAGRPDLFPADRRGEVIGRRLTRRVEAGQLLLSSDLDSEGVRRPIPAGSRLLYVDTSRIQVNATRIGHGTSVAFLIQDAAAGEALPASLGPFTVFEEQPWAASSDVSSRSGNLSLAVLVRDDDSQADALRSAVRNGLIRGLEVTAR